MDFNYKHSHCYIRWVAPNYLLPFQVPVDVFILGYMVELLRFAPLFGSGQILAQNSQTTSGHIWTLTYTTPHSCSISTFNRPFNQFRIHWSCSLPFNNLKQAHGHRSGVHSPRNFHTTHPVNNYLHQICSLFHMLQSSIACCYVEIIEDLSILHWFLQEEYSSTQKISYLGALRFRLISEGFFTCIASPDR